MRSISRLILMAVTAALIAGASFAKQTNSEGNQPQEEPAVPNIPSLEEVQAGKAAIEQYVPLDLSFRIGVIGDFQQKLETTTGPQTQIKTPLVLIDPSNGKLGVYAKNFPARIVANSPNGNWVIGIASSGAVEGSSGSRDRECAVSLDLQTGNIKMIAEFPLHSGFEAVFAPNTNDAVYYCINEPGVVNAITRYELATAKSTQVPAEGNRFYFYGLKQGKLPAMWVLDPLTIADYPILSLIDLLQGTVQDTIEFAGCKDVYVNDNGDEIVATVMNGAESSLGYMKVAERTLQQVPGLVLTKPTLKWTHKSTAVIAKESTSTRDRFLWIDLKTGQARELFSAYFKIAAWDIAPDDDALVFVSDSKAEPILFVVPLDPTITVVNRIRLVDVDNISWLGCLHPPAQKGSWLDKLLPF